MNRPRMHSAPSHIDDETLTLQLPVEDVLELDDSALIALGGPAAAPWLPPPAAPRVFPLPALPAPRQPAPHALAPLPPPPMLPRGLPSPALPRFGGAQLPPSERSRRTLPPMTPPPGSSPSAQPAASRTRFERSLPALRAASPAMRCSSPTRREPVTRPAIEAPLAPSRPSSIPPVTFDPRIASEVLSSVPQPVTSEIRIAVPRFLRAPALLGVLSGFVMFLAVWLVARPGPAAADPVAPGHLAAGTCTTPGCGAYVYDYPQPAYAPAEQAPISPMQLPLIQPEPVSPEPEHQPGAATVAPSPVTPSRVTRSPVPTPPQPAAFGTVNFNSIPISNVVLDGRPLGSTPVVGVRVPAGTHSVTFIHPDHGRRQTTLRVGPGQSKAAFARFTAED